MKVLAILSLFTASCLAAALQQQNAASEVTPQCAANCTIAAAAKLHCKGMTDLLCLCSQEFSALVTPCIESSCTVRQALTATKIAADMCGLPNPDGGKILEIIPPTCGAIATIVVTLRFAGKFVSNLRLRIEDFFALGSWMTLVAGFSIAIESQSPLYKDRWDTMIWVLTRIVARNGMGHNIWEIPQNNIYYIFKLYYIDEMIYITSLCFAKLAILFFYLTLFPLRGFRLAVYIFIALTAMYNVTFVFALAFQCVPASGAWTSWDGTFTGRCINVNHLWWIAAGLNIAFDVGIMGLPFFPLRKLQMSLKKKIQVGLMFGVGFFVTIVSVIRLQSLIQFGSTANPTYDDIPLGWWSTIEMCFAIVVSCMPSIRLFILHFFPRLDKDGSAGAKSGPSAVIGISNSRGLHYFSAKKSLRTPDNSSILDNTSTYELLEINDHKLADHKVADHKAMRI